MACMGYIEVHSFYNKKRRLAQTLELKGRLEDFISAHRNPEAFNTAIPGDMA